MSPCATMAVLFAVVFGGALSGGVLALALVGWSVRRVMRWDEERHEKSTDSLGD